MTSFESEARTHARRLVAEYQEEARRIAHDKWMDAPFLVNGEPEFWAMVKIYVDRELKAS